MSQAALHERPPLPLLLRWPGLVLAAVLGIAWRMSEGSLGALLAPEARSAAAEFARGFWPPAHSPAFLRFLARPLAETVAIAFAGMTLALVLAAPLAYLATAPDVGRVRGDAPGPLRRAAWIGARTVLNLMRSVPELVWALVFVRALGLGPAAGVAAIGIGYAGVVGKVFAEIWESSPCAPARALAAAGAPPRRAFALAVLPGSAPLLASYALYRLDCALRASAVLGLVGAGGMGVQLELSLKMFAYDEVATLVLALFAVVAAVDLLSAWARRRLAESRGLYPAGPGALRWRAAILGTWLALAAGAAAYLELPLGELFSGATLRSAAAFFGSMFPPDLSPGFLRGLAPAVAETLAVSVLGSALASVLGLGLALAAVHPGARGLAGAPGDSRLRAGARLAVTAGARGAMNLLRTLPELLWALVAIFAVGLGPFAGALALGIHNAGVLGRLYAEALEEVPPGPVAALRGAGARPLAATLLGALPQAWPQLVAYTLYRWEVAVRASAVLGVVGAGGIGALLHVSLNLFQHHRTLTLVAAIVLLVTAVDLFSGWLRARILAGPASRAAPRAGCAPGLANAT
ncbi:phosphonate ABC transporter, inner membrane subunit [Anaeromyxobacter dehalogenans 2CP-1]|uniref:Phosphonate ABC transporter, inner membrane subunit n=1 Tax=Anaeromyxobacter dehalogenans (strain ATCC BAA-258 / DSM 21875 / 2CP-1) TaxID=455488 RepID=B8JB31_ANAD2|nr:ABC transporter permease subunit [Anaeromyxobacter dehalogenans]ACL63842.1 phosphonate ABC transporter, inner membrane subunit [Anaeromyxobacter dehalogenans 2CP-1]